MTTLRNAQNTHISRNNLSKVILRNAQNKSLKSSSVVVIYLPILKLANFKNKTTKQKKVQNIHSETIKNFEVNGDEVIS